MEMISPTPSLPFTANALRRWLRRELSSGPRQIDDLADCLADERGIDTDAADELIYVGIEDDGAMLFVGPEDESVMLLGDVVQGITFTHRVTAEEAETGEVPAFPDFVVPLIVSPDIGPDAERDGRPEVGPDEPSVLVGIADVTWARRALPEEPTAFDHLGSTGVLNRTIVGPVGWLRSTTGDLVALTGTPAGWSVSVVSPSTAPAFDETLRTSVDEALAAITDDETGLVVEVVLDAIGRVVETDANLRTNWMAPLSEVVNASGRSIHLNLVGGPDVDWEAYDRRRFHDMFANIWSVTPAVADAMLQCMDCVTAVRRGAASTDSNEGLQAFVALLSMPGVVEGLAANLVQSFSRRTVDTRWPEDEPANAHEFTDTLAALLADASEVSQGKTRARIDWLASRVALDVDAARELLRSATKQDPRFLPVRDDLVWLAAVNAFDAAGRARLDLALQDWVMAGGVSKGVVQSREQASPRQVLRFACSAVARGTIRNSGPSIGRNDPCPCGSGRKYKQCHNGKPVEAGDGSPAPSAAVRSMVPWVQALQLLWFERTNERYFHDIVEELDAVPEGDQRNMITTFVVDADVSDAMRTEDFLDATLGDGASWPNGLAAIVRSWGDRPFGLYEVEGRVVGQKLWIRDLRTGERSVIEAPETSRHYGVGSMFLTRLVDNGETLQMSFGCIAMAFLDRERTLAMLDNANGRPDALTLAQFVGGGDRVLPNSGAPVMRNTDSEEIVIHRSLLRPVNAFTVDAVSAEFSLHDSLQRVDDSDDGAIHTWHVMGDGGLGQTVRGAIQVGASSDGAWLIVETNSVRRHGEALTLVRTSLGDILELDATIDDLDDRELAADFAEQGLDVPSMTPLGIREPSPDQLTPDVMSQIALQMEERWMSEGVPALGGLTPRQAADDPTRRRDLVALLASFPPGVPGMITFDPQRLAAALGVDLG